MSRQDYYLLRAVEPGPHPKP